MAGPVVADTHAALWYLGRKKKLSKAALEAIDQALVASEPVYVSAISLVEIIYLIEKFKLPRWILERLLDELHDASSSLTVAPLDEPIAVAVERIPRDKVSDMPDRIIAATALAHRLPLVTRDPAIRAAGTVQTIW